MEFATAFFALGGGGGEDDGGVGFGCAGGGGGFEFVEALVLALAGDEFGWHFAWMLVGLWKCSSLISNARLSKENVKLQRRFPRRNLLSRTLSYLRRAESYRGAMP